MELQSASIGKDNIAFDNENHEEIAISVNGTVMSVVQLPANDELQKKKEMAAQHETVVILQEKDANEGEKKKKVDPFSIVDEYIPSGPAWKDLNGKAKTKRVIVTFVKVLLLISMLYLFICSLGFLADAFQLLGGRAAGKAFSSNTIVTNPVAGLMIGVLGTVLLQSSSTTTSIVVAMVASGILGVRPAIPLIMGSNIGTSVTNTIVAIGQIGDKDQFRRAFAGATVHDMFNVLCVITLLPIEVLTGYLYHLTSAIISSMNLNSGNKELKKEFLKKITKPFTKLIIQLDKKVIFAISQGDDEGMKGDLIKQWCDKGKAVTQIQNVTDTNGTSVMTNVTSVVHNVPCKFLLHDTGLSEHAVGAIMLVIALFILCTCLIGIVKLLHSLLRGQIAVVIRKSFNSDFPKPFGFLTGYVALLVGAGMTILVQSSSIFTSAMTPLVGLGIVSVERIYPLTLGANIGTTATGILAALASSSEMLPSALQIALCHLFFNISGILLWYPVPQLRQFPIRLARGLGNTTAEFRWFAVAYLVVCFFLFPAFIFGLSLAGWRVLVGVMVPVVALIIFIVTVNFLQKKKPSVLPPKLRTWKSVPSACRSLEPYDKMMKKVFSASSRLRSNSFKKCDGKEESMNSRV